MKYVHIFLVVAFVIVLSSIAEAGVIWADNVEDYSSSIQNYGSTIMTESTEFWALGAPDADTNGNGYAWDSGEPDYVAGWRGGSANQYIIVSFADGLADVEGDDLNVWYYGGQNASCTLAVSTDGVTYVDLDTFGGGTDPGYMQVKSFDFYGLFGDPVCYVKVTRGAAGSGTGMFFDAFGGTAVPEPGTIVLLAAAGLIGLLAYVKRKHK